MATKTFCCARCKETVTEEFDEALAEIEFRATHPGIEFDPEKLYLICDPCYKLIVQGITTH